MFGFNNQEEQLPEGVGGNYGKFGLNTGAKLVSIEAKNTKMDGTPGESLAMEVKIGDGNKYWTIYPIDKVYAEYKSDGTGELTDKTSDAYKKVYERVAGRYSKVLTDLALLYVTEEQLKQALGQGVASFYDYVKIIEGAVKSNPNWQNVEFDLFLQWQKAPKKGKDETYLEVPSNNLHFKNGATIAKPIAGAEWEEVRSNDKYEALTYVDKNTGAQHVFKRSAWFMDQPFAEKIKEVESDNATAAGVFGATPNGNTTTNPGTTAAAPASPWLQQ